MHMIIVLLYFSYCDKLTLFYLSMTTIIDANDKWASYAGPGGWNGN